MRAGFDRGQTSRRAQRVEGSTLVSRGRRPVQYLYGLSLVEQIRVCLRYGRLANFAPNDVAHIHRIAGRDRHRLTRRSALLGTLPSRTAAKRVNGSC
jgi:hypothetical protein